MGKSDPSWHQKDLDIMKAIGRRTTKGLPLRLRQTLYLLRIKEGMTRQYEVVRQECIKHFGIGTEADVLCKLTGDKPRPQKRISAGVYSLTYETDTGRLHTSFSPAISGPPVDLIVPTTKDSKLWKYIHHWYSLMTRMKRVQGKWDTNYAEWSFVFPRHIIVVTRYADNQSSIRRIARVDCETAQP